MKKEPRRKDTDADAGADAGTLTRQHTWAPRSRGASKQAFLLTLRPGLDTLRRHGCCVFLRRLPGADFAVGQGVGCAAHRGVEAGPGRRGSTTSWSRGSPGEGRGGAAHHLRGDVLAQAAAPSTAPTRSSAALRWKLPPARRRQVFMFRDPIILFLVGLTNLLFLFFGVTPCAPDFFPGDHQVRSAAREGAGTRNARPGSACSSCPRPWVTNVPRVWWWYHVYVENRTPLSLSTLRAASMRAASSAAAKASGASEALYCKACRNFAKLGKQNGEARPRVPPCTWVRKAPTPRKKCALETRAATASGSTGDVSPRVRRSQRLQ